VFVCPENVLAGEKLNAYRYAKKLGIPILILNVRMPGRRNPGAKDRAEKSPVGGDADNAANSLYRQP